MQSLQLPQQSVQLLQQSLIFCNWNQFRLASPALKSDRDFILEGLNVHGWGPKIYQNISRELKADREIVRSAVCHDVDVLGYAVFEVCIYSIYIYMYTSIYIYIYIYIYDPSARPQTGAPTPLLRLAGQLEAGCLPR